MSLGIILDGVEYTGFTKAIVTRNIEDVASTFKFTATSSEDKLIPIREGDKVIIVADEKHKILTGYIDEYNINYNDKKHETTINGRSLTLDIVDSTVKATDTFENVGFVTLCKENVSEFGIKVINQAPLFRDFEDIDSPETGQKIFGFLESFARKRQVLLTDNEDGDLVITRASSEISPNGLINKINGKNNNIKSGSRKIDLSQLFNEYIGVSQLDPINFKELSDDFGVPIDTKKFLPKFLVEEVGIAFDDQIRSPRRLEFFTEETTDSFTLQDRAKWELSIRRARAFEYKCVVQGHTMNDIVWKPNILHQIDDDFARVFGQFLLKRLTYNYSLDEGSTTELVFTNKNAYTLQAEKDNIIIEFEEFG